MKYQDVRIKLDDLVSNGWIISDVRISPCEIVFDGDKFIDSHLKSLDLMKQLESKGVKINKKLVFPMIKRLSNYIEEVTRIKTQ